MGSGKFFLTINNRLGFWTEQCLECVFQVNAKYHCQERVLSKLANRRDHTLRKPRK